MALSGVVPRREGRVGQEQTEGAAFTGRLSSSSCPPWAVAMAVAGTRVAPTRTWMRVPTGVWVQASTTAQLTTAPTAASV
ncbi:hypothetical protein ACFXPV_08225 [Streptomyces sp. NPDC059118]|uniref:hypothetical protein n=1 Tax=unclassified Streptomyces TaxID=2593676 RepID=UPI00367ECC3D